MGNIWKTYCHQMNHSKGSSGIKDFAVFPHCGWIPYTRGLAAGGKYFSIGCMPSTKVIWQWTLAAKRGKMMFVCVLL